MVLRSRLGSKNNSGLDYLSKGERFDITDEQTVFYTRMLFNDEQPLLKKLTAEAKKACQFIGLNPKSLIKKDLEEVRSTAEPGLQPKVIELRFRHLEERRRKRLRFLYEYVKANK